jgi:hypothetical protein
MHDETVKNSEILHVLYIFMIRLFQLAQKSILAPEKLLATTVTTAFYYDVMAWPSISLLKIKTTWISKTF